MNCKRCKKELTEEELFESRHIESFGELQIRDLYECSNCGKINVSRRKNIEALFYLIICPYCGTGQQFENKVIGSHCNNPLCSAVVQKSKLNHHVGELMWAKDA